MTPTLSPRTAFDLAALVREAVDHRRPLAVHGAGTWTEPLARVREDALPVSLHAMRGIREYVPGDLTLTAAAGTTLAELEAATRPHGQWCPLAPWGSDDGTLGATFATATTGPYRAALGAPRDLALGLEFVDGTGAIVRAGGRVVKNVAGFDLTRMLVGAFGTLGVITEISIRLRARPVEDVTVLIACDASSAESREQITNWQRGPHAPIACVPVRDDASASLGLPSGGVLARIGGNARFVRAARDAAQRLGAVTDLDETVWGRYRASDPRPRRFGDAFTQPLAQRVRAQFDPHQVLNPGVLDGGES